MKEGRRERTCSGSGSSKRLSWLAVFRASVARRQGERLDGSHAAHPWRIWLTTSIFIVETLNFYLFISRDYEDFLSAEYHKRKLSGTFLFCSFLIWNICEKILNYSKKRLRLKGKPWTLFLNMDIAIVLKRSFRRSSISPILKKSCNKSCAVVYKFN